jgi:hypothetical protein
LEGASTNMQDVAIDAIENLEEGLRPSLLRTCLLFPGSLTFVLSGSYVPFICIPHDLRYYSDLGSILA